MVIAANHGNVKKLREKKNKNKNKSVVERWGMNCTLGFGFGDGLLKYYYPTAATSLIK